MERQINLDILRILACLAVIIVHTAGSPIYHNLVEKGSFDWACCVIMDGCVRWCVPVFAMITGYFFLNPNRSFSLKKLYGKNLSRLIISLVFWSLIYSFVLHARGWPLGASSGHFWYITMCIGLYISIPVLRLVAANKEVLSYSCWLWLFLRCYFFAGLFFELPIEPTDFVFTDYVGYCLWGYYLSVSLMNKYQERALYLLGLLGVLINVVVPFVHSSISVSAYETPNVILTSFAVFYYAIKHPANKVSLSARRIIIDVSETTFGIYMVHVLILSEVFFRALRIMGHPLLTVLLCVGGVFFLSCIIVWFIRRIPFIGKLVC